MTRLRIVLVVLVAALVAVPLASARPERRTATTVTVTMTEFKFALTKKSVPKGAVTFKVVNKGKIAHDFSINGKKTPHVSPGKSATLVVTFAKKGKYPYKCTVDSHAKFGMKGVLTVT
jgi:uncharacterized cupredoxin-like copper-binding protein